MAAGGSSAVITSCTHGATNFGIATNVQFNSEVTPLAVKNQGKMGNAAVGIVAKDFTAIVTFIAGAGAGPITAGTKASLSFVVADATGGGSKTYALTNMKALGFSLVHADRTTAVYTQTFVNEDDLDNTAFSAT